MTKGSGANNLLWLIHRAARSAAQYANPVTPSQAEPSRAGAGGVLYVIGNPKPENPRDIPAFIIFHNQSSSLAAVTTENGFFFSYSDAERGSAVIATAVPELRAHSSNEGGKLIA